MATPAKPWAVVSKLVYWDRDVLLDKWQVKKLEGSASYLPAAIRRMTVADFVYFLGKQSFIDHWPAIRDFVPSVDKAYAAKHDLTWSWLKSGTFNMKPESSKASWPGRKWEVYQEVLQHPGSSIYALAKRANMPYRKAHANVQELISEQLIHARQRIGNSNGRRQSALYPY